MEDKLENGRKIRILDVINEFTRECLALEVGFSIKQHDVIELLRCCDICSWYAAVRPISGATMALSSQ